MTFTEASAIIAALVHPGSARDRALENPGRCVLALEIYEDGLGDGKEDDRWDILFGVMDECPSLTNYDNRGNWIGPVANENGWTP